MFTINNKTKTTLNNFKSNLIYYHFAVNNNTFSIEKFYWAVLLNFNQFPFFNQKKTKKLSSQTK